MVAVSAIGRSRSLSIGADRAARVEVSAGRDYKAHVEVYSPDGHRWTYGVTDWRHVEFLTCYGERGLPVERDQPDWIVDVLLAIGLEVEG